MPLLTGARARWRAPAFAALLAIAVGAVGGGGGGACKYAPQYASSSCALRCQLDEDGGGGICPSGYVCTGAGFCVAHGERIVCVAPGTGGATEGTGGEGGGAAGADGTGGDDGSGGAGGT